MSDLTTVSVRSGSIVGQGSSPPGKPASVTNAPVWSRALIVFFGLVLVKVRLVLGQGESLYEMHWRLGGVRPGWVDGFAFFWFVILGGLTLIRLGKSCRSVGTSTVRVANAAVMVLSLFFLFLTFHNGDKNLLYPVLSGVLDWTSLSSYSANLLFFNDPFLPPWSFLYVSIYYVLVRTGREDRVMSLTAAFAVAY